ncbi:MAG: ABC transporter permease [Clostridia bacterium]|nr:ABC transporter permease [Clostridia bacterium]
MKYITFSKRNIIEYLRNPLMLFFTLIFPLLMFVIFQIIKLGTGASNDIVPMFKITNLIPSISVFSFSFLSLNLSTQISKDRTSSFQSRLQVSPMKSFDFFLGYLLPSLLISICQILLCFIIGFCFGLNISINVLYTFLCLIIISIFYISIGILIGSIFNEKGCGGISSIFINLTAIFSGMFFPLTNGIFKKILSYFPFLPSIAIPQSLLNNNYENFLLYFIVLIIYLVLIVSLSIFIFHKKLKNK